MDKTPLDLHREQEFALMTTRLQDALTAIRTDLTLVPDQETLCKLAGCSRRLLATPERRWAADELKALKEGRKEAQKPKKITKAHRETVDVHITKEKELEDRLEGVMRHHAGLVHEIEDLKDVIAERERELTSQKRLRAAAEARADSLAEQVRVLTAKLCAQAGSSVIEGSFSGKAPPGARRIR